MIDKTIFIISALLLVLFLSGCRETNTQAPSATANKTKSITPLENVNKDYTPCNPNAAKNTIAVLRYLAVLSGDHLQEAIAGQNCGQTRRIYENGHIMSYSRLVEGLYNKTGKWVGILGVDYEHDKLNTPDEFSRANEILIRYWNEGGLIAVGFSPINPWLNDETDVVNNPGFWTDTRTNQLTQAQLKEIDLNKLIDPNEKIFKAWRKKLDRIAAALMELQNAGVVVLFKPMQEANGFWFWWGTQSHADDPAPYINLYRDMFHYFTYEKGLNNLLWLYSPNRNYSGTAGLKPQMWIYPGDDYIDIVAPTTYNNFGDIYDYEEFVSTGKPLGMAEMGPDHAHNKGLFDNQIYIQRISQDYSGMAFWISWEDWHNGDGTNTYMSIIGNQNADKLMNHNNVITREDIKWKEYYPQE